MITTIDNKTLVIKNILEKLYDRYNHKNLIKPDPLQFIYNYSEPGDMEIAGLLSAALAYGRVEQIQKSLIKLFGLMGDSPFEYVLSFNQAKRKKLQNFKHRFNTGDDIADLLELLKTILKEYGSIEKYFLNGYDESHENIIPALTTFCNSLLKIHSSKYKENKGLGYLLVSPANGSACKRMNLFLRWMVRDDEVDSGIWKSIDKAKLIVPIDVHMGRLCRFLGFHDKNTISLKTAIEITQHFVKIEPNDPVKYDFALSRIGIIENCTGKHTSACQVCELNMFCKNR
ncbi:MAG: TIGR02757 family protein [Sedimentisphaerales bacterium]|nr:TIGR02757 family protein [Sedimentisphaerales bacterium]